MEAIDALIYVSNPTILSGDSGIYHIIIITFLVGVDELERLGASRARVVEGIFEERVICVHKLKGIWGNHVTLAPSW